MNGFYFNFYWLVIFDVSDIFLIFNKFLLQNGFLKNQKDDAVILFCILVLILFRFKVFIFSDGSFLSSVKKLTLQFSGLFLPQLPK